MPYKPTTRHRAPFTSFTKSQKQAIYQTLNDVHTDVTLEVPADWPKYLDAIEGIAQRAVYKAEADAREKPLYATKAHERLAKLHAALSTVIRYYADLGDELQRSLDSFLLLDPLLSASLPASARPTAELVLSSGRLPLALESLAEATNQCAISLNHQPFFPKTGAPRKYPAFNRAVEELMLIFQQATGQRPTMYSSEYTGYDGNFYPFAAAVLGPLRLVPGEQLGSNMLSAYNVVTAVLYGRKPTRKKKK